MRWNQVALCLLLAVLTAPIFMAPLPPLFAQPDHLARVDGLDLVADLGVPALGRILSLAVAERIFAALALVLPVLGTLALHRAIYRVPSWWPLGSALVVYNAPFLAGHYNFLAGTGLALLAAACWIRLKDRGATIQLAAAAPFGALIVFTHLLGLVLLLALIGSFEIFEARRDGWRAKLPRRAVKLICLFGLPAGLALETRLTGGTNAVSWLRHGFDPSQGLMGAIAPFVTYDMGTDLLILLGMTAALGFLVLGRKLGAKSWVMLIAALLCLAYLFIRPLAMSTAWVEFSLPVAASFLIFAGTQPRRLARREAALLAFAFAALMATRLDIIATAWQNEPTQIASTQAALAGRAP